MEPVVQVCTADKQVSQNLAPGCLNEYPLSKPLTAMLCPLRSISNLKLFFLWNFFQPSFLLRHSYFVLCTFSITGFVISSVQLLSHVRHFATPWIAARQVSLSITNSQSLLKLRFIESVMPSHHLILCFPGSQGEGERLHRQGRQGSEVHRLQAPRTRRLKPNGTYTKKGQSIRVALSLCLKRSLTYFIGRWLSRRLSQSIGMEGWPN